MFKKGKNSVYLLVFIISFVIFNQSHAYTLSSIIDWANSKVKAQTIPSIQSTAVPGVNKQKILKNAQGLDPKVLDVALKAYSCAKKKGLATQKMLTIVDYSKPSTENRLYVLNLQNNSVPIKTLVAHGKLSGANNAVSFSNKPRSYSSSLGLFKTGDVYSGKHGKSLRLHGLDKGYNHCAYKRSIVMHSASYVSKAFANSVGRLGRSLGCFAVSESISNKIIDKIKNGSLLFAYYPDKKYLQDSKFMSCA